jgi:hypothetical protein
MDTTLNGSPVLSVPTTAPKADPTEAATVDAFDASEAKAYEGRAGVSAEIVKMGARIGTRIGRARADRENRAAALATLASAGRVTLRSRKA